MFSTFGNLVEFSALGQKSQSWILRRRNWLCAWWKTMNR